MAIATLRRFAEASHALRVVVLVDQGDGAPATMLEWDPGGAVTVTRGERAEEVPRSAFATVAALPLDPPRPVPASAIEIDADQGRVSAPIGAVANLAMAVLDLARAFGGRSVATADFPTRSGEPLTIAARDGEPLVLAAGGRQFELPTEL